MAAVTQVEYDNGHSSNELQRTMRGESDALSYCSSDNLSIKYSINHSICALSFVPTQSPRDIPTEESIGSE